MPSADNFCKQFGPRSGPTKRRACSGSKLYDTLMVFLKEFFKKIVDFGKKQQTSKKHAKFPRRPRFTDMNFRFPVNPAVLFHLSYDFTSGSEITPCVKINKLLMVYRLSGNVMK